MIWWSQRQSGVVSMLSHHKGYIAAISLMMCWLWLGCYFVVSVNLPFAVCFRSDEARKAKTRC